MDTSKQVKVSVKHARIKLEKIEAYCLSNLETRSEEDHLKGFESACECILSIISE